MEYLFLVESTIIGNASFPYKTAISEANGEYKMELQRTEFFH